jgi:hypothetical protein
MTTNPKLLIKFPTRGRPDKFFNVLDLYINKAQNLDKIAFLITLDTDDITMNNSSVVSRLKQYQSKVKLLYFFGDSKTKIQAINADLEKVSGWDILLLASDDMIPVVQGYDYIIRKDMNDHFRDFDGVLWYNDGGQNNINTLSILGKKYYDRFGYIYHPDYISLWCDNEFTEVSKKLNKVYQSEQVIIEHQHPVYQKTNYDSLYVKNESYYNIDQQTYKRRESKNFFLEEILSQKLFSVLITSIPKRLDHLKVIINKLENQISKNNLDKQVEILSIVDNCQRTVGLKRQNLLDISVGKFIAYLDDDDNISDNYIEKIVESIKLNPTVDVISFNQEAKINQYNPVIVYFGLQYENTEFIPNTPIYRKPFHMCAWNTKIAKQVKFKDISLTEDWCWIESLCKIAKTEHHINEILHYYVFNNDTTTSIV